MGLRAIRTNDDTRGDVDDFQKSTSEGMDLNNRAQNQRFQRTRLCRAEVYAQRSEVEVVIEKYEKALDKAIKKNLEELGYGF